ncbi:MAG: hypothetical protein OEV28_05595 [Nitrospirota bacterium]|nr:hypothetical protein [Nitrospirota bacterium]
MDIQAGAGALALLVVLWVTGCAYNHKQFPTIVPSSTAPDDFVIQVDDYGQFWDQSMPNRALERISELSQTSNVIVILFVHGWNHDAAPDNQNLRDFAASVADTRRRLIDSSNPESAVYRQSRKVLTGTESLSVVSVYVGWRGRSLPGFLNYATFWGRKAAAERVGGGDLREFLSRLNALYREKRNLRASGTTQLFMGLTSFGHSFGGQVLFRSVAYEIENELLAQKAKTDTSRESDEVTDLIGFGDLVVLVNPAFEALQFERIWRLSTELKFGRQQNPVMLVVSSAGDVPRQVLFPIGRNLDALFLRPDFRPGQRALWTQALGEHEPLRTHAIEIVPESSQLTPGFDPSLYTSDPCAIENLDLTNLPAIAGVRLTPTENHRSNNPFVIAHASVSVVLDHSTVFEETLRKFLNDYIAITQGKRMLTARSSLECM